jgi:Fur family zinc uptake transcriptional regulator
MPRPSSLSEPAASLVLKALRRHKKPMTAYDLLARLKVSGIHSPPIIYRALRRLVALGDVHEIRALHAFVACDCSAHHRHELSVIEVCDRCDTIRERHDHAIMSHLLRLKELKVPLVDQAVIELPVRCSSCS